MKNQYQQNNQQAYSRVSLGRNRYRFGQVILLILLFIVNQVQAQTLPTNFSQQLVTNGLNRPNVIAFAADGRIFVAEQGGALRIIKNGSLLPTPFIQLNVDSQGERGLIGLTLDPNFAANQYVYLYYTVPSAPSHNRISRFTANGDVVLANSELVLLDMEPLSATNHNGGSLSFGKDGKLYAGVGENAVPGNAQTLENHLGKILRINPDGTIPADNPFPTGSAPRRRIWAYGLRNPYTITTQPGTGRIFVNDVGQSTYEEINEATTGGLNFGWPNAEGASANPAFTNPTFAYPHGEGDDNGCAITGGTFFNPPSTDYPAGFTGKYFYQDLCNQWINVIDVSGSGATRSAFATGLSGSPVGLATGLDGNLYYLSLSDNALYRIRYTPTPPPPGFAITGVTTVSCATVSAGQRRLTFTPQYAGLTGQLVSFWVRNESSPTTNAGPYTLNLYTDNPIITLNATQAGTAGEASFAYNWLAACSGGSEVNTPPTMANPISAKSATIGQAFSFTIPPNTFTDAQTPNNLTLLVNGLPAGLTFSAPATISGTPSASGLSEVTVTATDPGQLSVSTVFIITVSPASTPTPSPTNFAITGVSQVNCATVTAGQRRLTFSPQYAGLTSQPVSFWVRNESSPTTNAGPYTLNLYTDNPTIILNATQAGTAGETSFTYNWLAACSTGGARLGVEPTPALGVSVLGNPVYAETVDVDVRGALGERLRVQTFDGQGHKVGETLIEQAAVTERITLQLGRSVGLYFLRVSTPTQQKMVKIVKL